MVEAEAGQDPLVRRGEVSVLLAEGGEGEQAGLVRREGTPLAPPGVSNVEEGQDTGSVFNNVGFYNSGDCSMNSEIGKLNEK